MRLHPAILILGLLFQSTALAAAEGRPNIIFFLTDDQPLRAMGHEERWFHTPHMDRLADEGVEFVNAFVEASICAVSRASILTGQYNRRHGVQSFDTPLSEAQMERSFPVLLRKEGYRTAFLGKYGVGHTRAAPRELALPADSFDLWYGFEQSPSYAQMEGGEKRYMTSVMEEKAIRFMEETPKGQPFLIYMCLPEPHGQGGHGGPWNYRDPDFEIPPPDSPPPPVQSMTEEAWDRLPEAIQKSKNPKIVNRPKASYAKYMETVRDYTARSDLAIGRLRAALEAMGLEENTVIIFSSDNGTLWGAHGSAGKWNMYEESIRVPTIVYDPRLPACTRGTKRAQMVLNIDLPATILDLGGLPVPDEVQGMSLLPLLKDPGADWRDDWYYYHFVHSRSSGAPLPQVEGVRTERFKYIRYPNQDPVEEELFDLETDPEELHDLSGNPMYAALFKRLRQRCDALREATE